MSTVLIVIQVIIVILLISVVLIQRSSSGFTSSASAGMGGQKKFGPLAKFTAVVAALFFLNSLLLAIHLGRQRPADLIVEVEEENKVFEPDISGSGE